MSSLKERVEDLINRLQGIYTVPVNDRCGTPSKQLTATQQKLDVAVEALEAGKEAIEILIEEKIANMDNEYTTQAMMQIFELTKSTGKKVHELIAERFAKVEAALTTIRDNSPFGQILAEDEKNQQKRHEHFKENGKEILDMMKDSNK